MSRTERLLERVAAGVESLQNRPVVIDAQAVWSDQIKADRRRRGPLTRGYG